MRSRFVVGITLAALAVAGSLAVSGHSVTQTGASFTDHIVVAESQESSTATLGPITSGFGTRNAQGQTQVSWDAPSPRADVAPTYTVTRTVAGQTQTIAPTMTGAQFSDDVTIPAQLQNKTVTQVSTGGDSSCAVADGAAYCWGIGLFGQLGNGSTNVSSVPVAVDTSGVLAGKTVTSVSVTSTHACAVADGAAYCWGQNTIGELGDGLGQSSLVPVAVNTSGVLNGKTVTAVSAGQSFTCAIADGAAYCWGQNGLGQLGSAGGSSNVPVAVDTSGALAGKTITAIGAGWSHACAVASGAAYCWGNSIAVGHENTGSVPAPVDTSGVLAGKTVTAIQAGNAVTCAVASGAAYCWGYGTQGELGNGGTTNSNVPVAVDTSGVLSGKTVTGIAVRDGNACAFNSTAAYCWGKNEYGQLGDGTTTGTTVPVQMNLSGIAGNKQVTSLRPGGSSTCVVVSGVVYCMGYGNGGRLGTGNTSNSSLPVPVVTSGVLSGLTCASSWHLTSNQRCAPGENVAVSYGVSYKKRGWSAPAVTVTPQWEG